MIYREASFYLFKVTKRLKSCNCKTEQKIDGFFDNWIVKSKIVLENQTIEQVNNFNFISYDGEKDIYHKKATFTNMCSTIKKIFHNKTSRETHIKFCKVMQYQQVLWQWDMELEVD